MLELNKVYNMDCIEGMKLIPDNSIDSIVTDPPYEIGFMGKGWDSTGIANNVDMRKECLRILKPGGHLLSFAATRTYHRMACAIEDAGFEVRDMIEWVYGSGFPKSLNIGKAVDKRGGTTSDQSKEFAEYIKNKRTELNITLSKADEVICGGTTNYSWFEGRPAGQRLPRKADYLKMKELLKLDDRYDSFMEETEREFLGNYETDMGGLGGERLGVSGGSITKGTSEWEGWGTALKPAHEPICMARKPLGEKTIAENVLKYGTGGINIDESRVETEDKMSYSSSEKQGVTQFGTGTTEQSPLGRFPANIIHDNSEEVRECFPDTKPSKIRIVKEEEILKKENTVFETSGYKERLEGGIDDNGGNASRFFKSIIYTAKASKSERNKGCEELEEKDKAGKDFRPNHAIKAELGEDGNAFGRWGKIQNNHPTVKPTALMEYLIKMVTKEGGTVLDPFTGSGTTLVAAKRNLYNYIGFELSKEYCDIIEARLKSVQVGLF